MKQKYTATFTPAIYTGNHLPIKNKQGVYYWNEAQNSFLFRPDATSTSTSKTDWFRVHKTNLKDLKD
jgi:hypothetical protein